MSFVTAYDMIRYHAIEIVTLAASSGKHNVSAVWLPSVCPSVCLSRQRTHSDYNTIPVTYQAAACNAASVHFGPTIRRRNTYLYSVH